MATVNLKYVGANDKSYFPGLGANTDKECIPEEEAQAYLETGAWVLIPIDNQEEAKSEQTSPEVKAFLAPAEVKAETAEKKPTKPSNKAAE